MFRPLLSGLAALLLVLPLTATAQEATPQNAASQNATPVTLEAAAPTPSSATNPPLPDTLQNLAAKGAQIRYLGREKGLDGWIAIQNGQEQYFYATPDREAIIMGLLFDKTGKMLTIKQVQNLQAGHDPTIESLLADNTPPKDENSLQKLQQKLSAEAKVPQSQKFFDAIEKSNWITLGSDKAPVIYAFLDPQCPHCQAFMRDIRKDFIDAGQLQVRMIPVGFREDTRAQAAILLAAQNPKDLWYRHLDGDEKALPVSTTINGQAVEANLAVMQAWKLDATPIIVYKNAKGEVKIIRGRPKNPGDILNDLHG